MRRLLSWAAAAAILAVPAGARAQQDQKSDSSSAAPQGQAQPQASGQSSPAQAVAPQQESLADAARKAREAKKDQAKPAHVYDNDNLPGGTVSTVGKEAKEGDNGAGEPADKNAPSADSEKTWRAKFADLRAKLDRDKEDLDVMQRELGVLNLQNYSDPVKGMQQELTRDDINKKTADIDAKRKQIDADQQAIDDAEEDLRKSGGDPGWAR
jgi:hypothetical protein